MHNNLFEHSGAHVLVDGQFGSTGKGVLAAWLAKQAFESHQWFDLVVSNAGPNSGHTFYHGEEKHVLKQLPTFAVAWYLMDYESAPHVYLSAGAIIDLDILRAEAEKYPMLSITVDPMAAVIMDYDKEAEKTGTIAAVAGTRSGTGSALANKINRDPMAVFQNYFFEGLLPSNVSMYRRHVHQVAYTDRVFVEVSQGFSLGINSEFYPKVTSRECTVMQAMADARIPPHLIVKTYVSARTYPIRVGNVDGFSSGDHYTDQTETTWEAIGQTPELTTVTQRVRRVFTFSEQQLQEAVDVNGANFVFLNFMNYLDEEGQVNMLEAIDRVRDSALQWFDVITCSGPTSDDVKYL
jgi:adenylosuccinate synthase